jgi:hypothetical protein
VSVLVPVGLGGGINSGFPDVPNGWGTIRLGDHLEHLDRASYRLWRQAAKAMSREQLIAWGTTNGIGFAKQLIDELVEPGLLVDVGSPDGAALQRLIPIMIGECGGNGAQISPDFSILGRRGAHVRTDGLGFQFLLRCNGRHSVVELCDAVDGTRPSEITYRFFDRFQVDGPAWIRDEVLMLDAP